MFSQAIGLIEAFLTSSSGTIVKHPCSHQITRAGFEVSCSL